MPWQVVDIESQRTRLLYPGPVRTLVEQTGALPTAVLPTLQQAVAGTGSDKPSRVKPPPRPSRSGEGEHLPREALKALLREYSARLIDQVNQSQQGP